MSDDNPEANNIPAEAKEPPAVTAIRDAIKSLLPVDENIVSNVNLHDGIASISVRWRSLRWNQDVALAGRDAETIALSIDDEFRKWLKGTVSHMKDRPKHGRVVAEMARWLKANPDKKKWLFGDEPAPEKEPEAAS